jgi:hypothetical protein
VTGCVERDLLYGGCDGDREKRDLRIVPCTLPSYGLLVLAIFDGDACVLTIARRDHNRPVFDEESVRRPIVRCTVNPIHVSVDYALIQISDVFKVKSDSIVPPVMIMDGKALLTSESTSHRS